MKHGRQHKPISKTMQRVAKSERDKAYAQLGNTSYKAAVTPFFPHLRAAMQRHDCDALTAARFLADSLQEIGCKPGVQRLITYAAVDLQFGAALEVAA